jgi:hypothetical protein
VDELQVLGVEILEACLGYEIRRLKRIFELG